MADIPAGDGVNPLIDKIRNGELSSEKELRSFYRRAAKRVHPDGGRGGDGHRFIRLTAQYGEALTFLSERQGGGEEVKGSPLRKRDRGKEFYAYWYEWENLDLPFNRTRENRGRGARLFSLMERAFLLWRPERKELFLKAMEELVSLKRQKYPNDLAHLRQSLPAERLRPLLYGICRYALMGRPLHRRLIDRMAPAVLEDLAGNDCPALREFLEELIASLP